MFSFTWAASAIEYSNLDLQIWSIVGVDHVGRRPDHTRPRRVVLEDGTFKENPTRGHVRCRAAALEFLVVANRHIIHRVYGVQAQILNIRM